MLFSLVAILFVIDPIYGYKNTDPEYKQYYESTGKPVGFNENLLINSCVLLETPTTLIVDSIGLENTIFEGTRIDPYTTVAQHVFVYGYGHTITDTDIDCDRTRITLMK